MVKTGLRQKCPWIIAPLSLSVYYMAACLWHWLNHSASLAGFLCIEEGQVALGLDINANHLRPVKKGFVTAKATPIALSQNTHVWQIDIRDEQDKLCCVSRLTLSIKHL